VLPLHPSLEAHLNELASVDKAQVYLSSSLAEKRIGGKTGLSETFKKIMNRAGIDCQTAEGNGSKRFSALSFHSFRHKFISTLANNNTPTDVRMQLVGHSSEEIHGNYTHLALQTLKKEIMKIPSLS
ncbi:MAG: hypothetical protein JWM68_389, partial [Verrucomicrobiales bacterium]|nr:hypothetical protein [Verrucomicrobiales bacterium]